MSEAKSDSLPRRDVWVNRETWRLVEAAYLLAGIERLEDPGVPDSATPAVENHYDNLKGALLQGTLQSVGGFTNKIGGQRVVPAECIRWALARGQEVPRELAALAERPAVAESIRRDSWPWGDYETKSLRALADAVRQFWTTYDPENGATSPGQQDVIDYLVKHHKLTARKAQVVAVVIRADNAPTGRRKNPHR